MHGIPVMLHVTGRRCLVIGGGAVAIRRARNLLQAGARVTVIAPEVCDELRGLGVELRQREVTGDDLDGWFLIVVATSSPAVRRLLDAADLRGALVNRADDAASGEVDFMATHRDGPLTIAVHSGGVSASAAAAIRTDLADGLDPAWPRLLVLAAPYRARIQAAVPDPTLRARRLRQLTDSAALAILKGSGEAAFRAYCEALAEP